MFTPSCQGEAMVYTRRAGYPQATNRGARGQRPGVLSGNLPWVECDALECDALYGVVANLYPGCGEVVDRVLI